MKNVLIAVARYVSPVHQQELRRATRSTRSDGSKARAGVVTARQDSTSAYRLVDDSTLVVESFSDSTLAKANDTSYFDLRGDRVTSRGQRQWVARAFSADSIKFELVRRVKP